MIYSFFIFLHQNSTSAHITCSLISIKGLLKFGTSNTGAEINRFFDLVKGILTSLTQATADLSSTTVSLAFLLLRSSYRTFYNTLPSSGNASVPVDLLELYKCFSFYTNWINCLSLSSTLLTLLWCSHNSMYTITSSVYPWQPSKPGNDLIYPLEGCRGIFHATRHAPFMEKTLSMVKAEISFALLDKGTCQYPLSKSSFVMYLECPLWSSMENESDLIGDRVFTLWKSAAQKQ